jgi:glycosyltransferase involved in cell wall biosynthesis
LCKMTDTHVIVCIPYYNCQPYIRRAVKSIMSQTHKNLTVVVINDADFATPPWPAIADIDDPRLVRFEMMKNRGPYFAIEVLLEATRSLYLLNQDADDWSEPDRLSKLLKTAVKNDADFVTSSQLEFNESGSVTGTRWANSNDKSSKFFFQPGITPQFDNRAPHQGLFKIQALKKIGGYYGGFKINYDVFLTNLVLMTCRVCHIDTPLYNYFLRKNSLSRGEKFGYKSTERKDVKKAMASMYEIAYEVYCKHLQGDINSDDFFSSLSALCRENVSDAELSALRYETNRLAKVLP